MGGGGFEPPKRYAADLQSAPFGHLGTRPFMQAELGPHCTIHEYTDNTKNCQIIRQRIRERLTPRTTQYLQLPMH